MKSITIRIPMLPDSQLTLNRSRKVHWGTVTRLKNTLMMAAFYAAVDAKNRWLWEQKEIWEPLDKALLMVEFIVPNSNHIRDDDNAISGLKPVRDVLQCHDENSQGPRAGIYKNDRDVSMGGILWIKDKDKAPMTVVNVYEIKEETNVRNEKSPSLQ